KVDFSEARVFLTEDFGRRSLAGWVHQKFGLALDPGDWTGLSKADVIRRIQDATRSLYTQKEIEFPVRVGMSRFLQERTAGQAARYDREGLARWASERFQTVIDAEELRPLLRPEIESLLLDVARKQYQGEALTRTLNEKLDAAFGPKPTTAKHPQTSPSVNDQALVDLAAFARLELDFETTGEALGALGRNEARQVLLKALDTRHRPEMREMEKVLLLQFVDSSWMEHLRAMDHLRSSIGLQGYAQIDPKVEYKREGMKIFTAMWEGISDKVTDLVFRVEQFDPDFLSYLGARWQLDRAQTIHQSAPSELATAAAPAAGSVRAQQDAAIAASQHQGEGETKREPVRNTGRKVGRNDPCPCGSGKKFKACCMRKEASSDLF
ncbi:MAG: SEC-C metal-binding domain-containing protein, partial [Isosphaeraceae bacterium]